MVITKPIYIELIDGENRTMYTSTLDNEDGEFKGFNLIIKNGKMIFSNEPFLKPKNSRISQMPDLMINHYAKNSILFRRSNGHKN